MPHLSAMRSAPSNCEVGSYCGKYDLGNGRPGPAFTLDPSGIRLIDSTPQEMTMSAAPEAMRPAPRLVACCDEPHWLSTVVAATVSGHPAVSPAVRPRLNVSAPAWAQPPRRRAGPGEPPRRPCDACHACDRRAASQGRPVR